MTTHARQFALAILLGVLLLFVLFPAHVSAQPVPAKKFIEYGWDVPYPDFILKNIRAMEQHPFDGIIFRLKQCNHAFDTRLWASESLRPELESLAAIRWEKFTDNFLMLYAANNQGMDWFNDAHWATITANMKLFMDAVKAGRCVGVCFDPEPYGNSPWAFKAGGKSFEECCAMARRRGRQFISTLQSSTPNLKILSLFNLSIFSGAMQGDEARRVKQISDNGYALWWPFFIGMLEGSGPGVTFIDGNESSYYYTQSEGFFRAYHMMRQRALALVPEELRARYNAQAQAGMALYVDQVLGLRAGRAIPANFLSDSDRIRYAEHNAYYALTTADQYVWCYGEKMNWWGTQKNSAKAVPPQIPAGFEAALVSARRKCAEGQTLGFDITSQMLAAQQKLKEKSRK